MQQVFVHHCDSVLSQQRSKATPSITLPSEAVASCPAAPTPFELPLVTEGFLRSCPLSRPSLSHAVFL